MKISRVLVLVVAAAAGSFFYKARQSFTAPGTSVSPGEDAVPEGGFYDSLTGAGSLMANIKEHTDVRDAEIANTNAKKIGRAGRKDKANVAATREPPDDLALIMAASRGDAAAVEQRLVAKSKVDSRDSLRRTALMYAAWNGYADLCSRLIAAGANPEFRDRQGHNIFDFAAGRGQLEEVRFLLARTNTLDQHHYEEYAQLIQAAFAGDASLLPKGDLASVNRINPEGQAPLHIAAGNGSIELMRQLVARGADVNIANNDKQTPLHWAAWNNKTDVIKLLLEQGAHISQADLAGNTPLIFAAQNGSAQASLLLLKQGANRYVANKSGKTASVIAEQSGYRDLAQLLK